MKRKRKTIQIMFGLLVLAPVVLLALLQTPPGKQLLASELERRLSASENLDVRLGTISGWIPASVQIDRLEIGDAEGIWLSAGNLHGRWRIQELFDHRIRLARLGAQSVELHRLPKNEKADRTTRSEPRVFRPMEIVLDQLAVRQLKLGKAVAGLPLEYSVKSGGIHLLPSGRLTGALTVEGDAVGRVELDALLGGHDSRLRILAELDRLVNPALGLDHLSGTAEATVTRSGLQAAMLVAVRKDTLEGILSADLEYAAKKLQVPQFDISGYGCTAEGQMAIDFAGENVAVRLDAELVDAVTNTWSLHTASALSRSNGSWSVAFHPFELGYLQQVCLLMEGSISPERLAMEGSLQEFDLNILPLPGFSGFTGNVEGRISLAGSMANPEVHAKLDVLRFTSVEEALDELPELNFHVSGKLADGQMQAVSVITNATHGRMKAGFRMPCAFSLEPVQFAPEWRETYADLLADIDLRILNQLALLNDQRVSGRLDVDLAYDKELAGSLRMQQGEYEHFKWGVVVRDITLDLAASGEGVQVHSATATDGDTGRLAMTGGVVSNQFGLALNLSRAAVVRRDDVEGMLSGRIEIAGPLARPAVTGKLTVDRADILIDNFAPSLPPLLTDYDALAGTQTVTVVRQRAPLPFGLDLNVDLADQVYADASMINSIWGGNLRVRDVPQGISVQGVIEPRRGHVSFIGKKFRFTDGRIDVDGAVPAMPSMNQLTAEYTRADFTARLILNGRLDNPDYRLESTPAMPEDEILSHVLFDRDTSSITPYQAFQIAAAARQLSGGLSGPGFMYQMRQAVGVDTLEWREGAEAGDASSVAAGKYLTPALYVEVNRSLDEKGGTGMMAEYEITRHFSVETSTGAQMRPGVGVNWKNDY